MDTLMKLITIGAAWILIDINQSFEIIYYIHDKIWEYNTLKTEKACIILDFIVMTEQKGHHT